MDWGGHGRQWPPVGDGVKMFESYQPRAVATRGWARILLWLKSRTIMHVNHQRLCYAAMATYALQWQHTHWLTPLIAQVEGNWRPRASLQRAWPQCSH
jgi:hypothetical protein